MNPFHLFNFFFAVFVIFVVSLFFSFWNDFFFNFLVFVIFVVEFNPGHISVLWHTVIIFFSKSIVEIHLYNKCKGNGLNTV